MKVKVGNYITKVCELNTISMFQRVGYQILYGNYIDQEFKKKGEVLSFTALKEKYKSNISFDTIYDLAYYRISDTGCSYIIQFLNSGLEIVAGVETIPEGKGFE